MIVNFEKPDGSKKPVEMPHDRVEPFTPTPEQRYFSHRIDPVQEQAKAKAKADAEAQARPEKDYGEMPKPNFEKPKPGPHDVPGDYKLDEGYSNAGESNRHWMSR